MPLDPEKRREYQRQWYAANREKKLKYQRQWYEEHREERRQWYVANRAKCLENVRRWQKANPEKTRKHVRRYKAKLRPRVLAILGGKCARCGFDGPRALQVNHINGGGIAERTALGREGVLRKVLSDPTEYQLLCANCNWIKRFENGEHGHHLTCSTFGG